MMQKPEPTVKPYPNGTSKTVGETATTNPTMTGNPTGATQSASTSGTPDNKLVQRAKDTAADVAGQAREQVTTKASAQKDRATEGLTSVATALRQTSEQLRSQDTGPVSQYVEQAADQVEKVTQYLQSKSVGEIVGEVERFARREPALFLGGAFALGLLGARFLKSSNRDGAYTRQLPPPQGAYTQRSDVYNTLQDFPGPGYGYDPTRRGGTGGF